MATLILGHSQTVHACQTPTMVKLDQTQPGQASTAALVTWNCAVLPNAMSWSSVAHLPNTMHGMHDKLVLT